MSIFSAFCYCARENFFVILQRISKINYLFKATMLQKKSYIVPSTTVVGMAIDAPVMVTMTLYTGSPYTTLETVTSDGPGYTWTPGEW